MKAKCFKTIKQANYYLGKMLCTGECVLGECVLGERVLGECVLGESVTGQII